MPPKNKKNQKKRNPRPSTPAKAKARAQAKARSEARRADQNENRPPQTDRVMPKNRKDKSSDHRSGAKTSSQSDNRYNDHKSFQKREPRQNKANPRLIYGVHAVTEALLNPKRSIQRVFATKNAKPAVEVILEEAATKDLKPQNIQIMDRDALDAMLPSGAVHQGMVIDAAPLEPLQLDHIIEKSKLFVILDQVTDPHNVGAILRSASAFGADGVIVQDRHAPDITGILAKIACGAVEHVPMLRATNLSRVIEELQDNGFTCIGFDEHGAMSLAEMTLPEKTVLVMGAEGDGLRRLIAEKCDVLVKLPTQGRIASLNVSNAAAIALYEVARLN